MSVVEKRKVVLGMSVVMNVFLSACEEGGRKISHNYDQLTHSYIKTLLLSPSFGFVLETNGYNLAPRYCSKTESILKDLS